MLSSTDIELRSAENLKKCFAFFKPHISLHKQPRGIGHLSDVRHKVGKFLESHKFQYFIIFLVAVDVCIVSVELLLVREGCKENEHDTSGFKIAEEVLYYISLTILILFAIETVGLLFAFGLKFFKHPLYVSDLIIIITALVLDIALREELSSLLIITRIWRLIRIGHAIVLVEEEAHNRTKIETKHRIGELEKQLKEKDKNIEQLHLNIVQLHTELSHVKAV